jgi:NADH-quinone oxidoreductase subunit G
VPENAWQAETTDAPLGAAPFRYALHDFYLTNPIARSSELMAELSRGAKARASAPLAAE